MFLLIGIFLLAIGFSIGFWNLEKLKPWPYFIIRRILPTIFYGVGLAFIINFILVFIKKSVL